MPYALPPGAGPATTGIELRVDTPRRFTLITPFQYAPPTPLPALAEALPPMPPDPPDDEHRWLQIPSGETDLGSVPGVLWGLIANYGRHTLAVLVHDHLTAWAGTTARAGRFVARSAADEVFYRALRDREAGLYQAPGFRSLAMWAGVSIGRYWTDNRGGFAALAGAVAGGWLAGWWAAENSGGRSLPVAGWVLALVGLILMAAAGLFAIRLAALQPRGVGISPAHPTVAPTKLQEASMFMPGREGTVGRSSDVWVVRALAIAAMLAFSGAAWTTMPIDPVFGIGVPGFLAALGLVAFVGGSLFLATSPVRRDGLLPLLAVLLLPTVGLVALVTTFVLYLLWLPDAFSTVSRGPVNTIE